MNTPRDNGQYTPEELTYWQAIRQWSTDLRDVRAIEMEFKAISKIAVPLDELTHTDASYLPPAMLLKAQSLHFWCEVRLARLQHLLIDARSASANSYKQIPDIPNTFQDPE